MNLNIDAIKSLIEPVLEKYTSYLVEIQGHVQGKGSLLRLLVQDEQGITLDKIAKVTKEINRLETLDEMFPDGYRLEISSPGADFPLKDPRDFKRNIGRTLEIHHENEQFDSPFTGILSSVSETEFKIELKKEKRLINFNDLDYAKIRFKF